MKKVSKTTSGNLKINKKPMNKVSNSAAKNTKKKSTKSNSIKKTKIKNTRVLVIMPTLDVCGGIERSFFNYYSYMPKHIKFDIITHHSDSDFYKNIIEKRGDNLYVFDKFSLKSLPKLKRQITEFFEKNHDYDVVHCQMINAAFLYLKEAKKWNIKKRIVHNHLCKLSDNLLHSLRNIPLVSVGKRYANIYAACGKDAGEFAFKKSEFKIITNAIDYKTFSLDQDARKEIRKKFKIKNSDVLVGNVGRLAPAKNQKYLLEILKNCPSNVKLMIIGNGPLEADLLKQTAQLDLAEKVFFVHSTDNINDYYSAFDIFVLPSKVEGLPFVGVEAQLNGLKCIFSESITEEVIISENSKLLPIDKNNINKWIEEFTLRNSYKDCSIDNKFNIKKQYKELVSLYEK